MPLSASELADRLWDGHAPVDGHKTVAVVPLLSPQTILKRNTTSIDLRLGRWFRTMRQAKLTSVAIGGEREEVLSKEQYVRFNDTFVLHPGQFVIGITLEWIKLPSDLAAYVSGRSSWGRRGLIIETAAGVHPEFTGCLTLELANVGLVPIKLSPGMELCQLFFHHVANREPGATTQFVGHRKPALGKVRKDHVLEALGRPYFKPDPEDSGSQD